MWQCHQLKNTSLQIYVFLLHGVMNGLKFGIVLSLRLGSMKEVAVGSLEGCSAMTNMQPMYFRTNSVH